jgi:hypothetical protein
LRRMTEASPFLLALTLAAFSLPAIAQQPPIINPRIPPPPPPAETPATPAPVVAPAPATPAPVAPPVRIQFPEKVIVPAGTHFAVTLDTPVSTRISKKGQIVNFRTSEALPVSDNLVIPPDTLFIGKVVEARRPGSFGRTGALRVKVERIELSNGAGAEVAAKLDSPDMNGKGRLNSDNNRTANLINLAMYSAQGTLLGARIGGGKGAAIGAGSGAALALILLMSRHGTDVYLEPGMPFEVALDQPVTLPGQAVAAAQPKNSTSASGNGSENGGPESTEPSTGDNRPKLKHRPKPPQ